MVVIKYSTSTDDIDARDSTYYTNMSFCTQVMETITTCRKIISTANDIFNSAILIHLDRQDLRSLFWLIIYSCLIKTGYLNKEIGLLGKLYLTANCTLSPSTNHLHMYALTFIGVSVCTEVGTPRHISLKPTPQKSRSTNLPARKKISKWVEI